MSALGQTIRVRLLGIPPEATGFDRRGFRGGMEGVRERVEAIGAAFRNGYHAALEESDLAALGRRLEAFGPDLAGFAFEGAAMALALLDGLTPWRRDRVDRFLCGSGARHVYTIHVGVGWAWARLPIRRHRAAARLDPLLRWLAWDGLGFHEGFFHWPRYIRGGPAPRGVTGYAARAFDQGFGRSLWFVDGGDPERIGSDIDRFAVERRDDLWSGVGLAATYAGTMNTPRLEQLQETAGIHAAALAQGAAFAAQARRLAGAISEHTERAALILCGCRASDAAGLTDTALVDLPADGHQPAFETWRQRLQLHFRRQGRFLKA